MNIQTVADNLRNTITGKEQLLATYAEREELGVYPKTLEYKGICAMLEINIDELKRILKDVEQCLEKAVSDSWASNPDRSGGGGWSDDELDPNRGWK